MDDTVAPQPEPAAEDEAARLAEAIAAGGQLASLLEAARAREAQRTQLAAQLQALDRLGATDRLDIRQIETALRARVKDWRGLLGRQVPVARQILTKLLDGRLVFTPRPEDRAYEFAGQAVLGKLLAGVVPPEFPWHWRPQSGIRTATATYAAPLSVTSPR